MTAPQFTGSDKELDAAIGRLRDLIERIPDSTHATCDKADLRAVLAAVADRDAAVARHLAEAGAVHPAVHTPERVAGWMEAHGWKRDAVTDMSILWTRDARRTVQPLLDEAVDFPGVTLFLVRDVASAHGLTVEQVLLEIASMPEELAW